MATDRRTGAPAHCWWQALVRDADGEPQRLLVVQSPDRPDGSRVELSHAEAQAQPATALVCTADLADGAVTALHVALGFASRMPALWYAELAAPDAEPPAVDLVAFTHAGPTPGSLVGTAELAAIPVSSSDQFGAVRWWPGTGEVDQVYVAPAWRRHHVAAALLAAAGTLAVARGWPRLWSDGQRTSLGEQLRRSRAWRDRAADLTHLAPPMTPEGIR